MRPSGFDQPPPDTYIELGNLAGDVRSSDDLDDLLTTIGTQGIDMLKDQQRLPSSAMERKFEEEAQHGEDIALDLPQGALEKSTDLVGIYLREMRAVPLLRREEEVDIAKRIERGQLRALKALSRSPIVIRQILAIGKDLKHGVRSIKEIVAFDEEITERILQNRVSRTSRAASTSCRSITK
jgi:RNA polymerase primary sigma factor